MAKAKNKKAVDKPKSVGRPTLYKPEYNEMARKHCLLGATDHELADLFGVSDTTIDDWKEKYPKFVGSIRDGKEIADAQVAESLFKRATGYTAKKVVTANIAGVISDIREVNDYVGPDTAAASLWLRNRQPTKWRDKVDHELSGTLKISRAEDLTDDQLAAIANASNGSK